MLITIPEAYISWLIRRDTKDEFGHSVQSQTIKRTAYRTRSHAFRTRTEISDEAFFREKSQVHACALEDKPAYLLHKIRLLGSMKASY
jgi:hypothetical protein